jgi:hypothetical protein
LKYEKACGESVAVKKMVQSVASFGLEQMTSLEMGSLVELRTKIRRIWGENEPKTEIIYLANRLLGLLLGSPLPWWLQGCKQSPKQSKIRFLAIIDHLNFKSTWPLSRALKISGQRLAEEFQLQVEYCSSSLRFSLFLLAMKRFRVYFIN